MKFFVPEVLQVSAMDCGPGSLKCLLEGNGIDIHYGRLRELCQTDVDGTSSDVMAEVAQSLGLNVDQLMVPLDFILECPDRYLPGIIVTVKQNRTHFEVLWKRHGQLLQLMDPGRGRYWRSVDKFHSDVFILNSATEIQDWRAWAVGDEFLGILRCKMKRLKISSAEMENFIQFGLADPGWKAIAALDAALRMLDELKMSGVFSAFKDASGKRLSEAHWLKEVLQSDFSMVPKHCWQVTPNETALILSGCVLLSSHGPIPGFAQASAQEDRSDRSSWKSRLRKRLFQPDPSQSPFHLLRSILPVRDQRTLALLVVCQVGLSVAAVLEALILREFMNLRQDLVQLEQRIGALFALLFFLFIGMLIQFSKQKILQSLGRRLEGHLRIKLFHRLPRMNDQFFRSRPFSDLVERCFSLTSTRNVLASLFSLLASGLDLLVILLGTLLIFPNGWPQALGIFILSVFFTAVGLYWLREKAVKFRTFTASLSRFYLDVLKGKSVIQAHVSESSFRYQFEGILDEWQKSLREFQTILLLYQSVTNGCLLLLGVWMIYRYFQTPDFSSGSLLLFYWVMRFPALVNETLQAISATTDQRAVLLRVGEPIYSQQDFQNIHPVTEPQETPEPFRKVTPATASETASPVDLGVKLKFEKVSVLAAGQLILNEVNFEIPPGQHVAVVGSSGSGKSTLAATLLGFHRPSHGHYYWNGNKYNPAHEEIYRRKTVWIDPDVQLWNRPLIDNILYGYSKEVEFNLSQIMKDSDLEEVLQNLPSGFSSYLGESGSLLSGGEGQRVRFARSLIRGEVDLVLLDEAFRGLPRDQRSHLLETARGYWKRSTLLCITHDLKESLTFDRVLVIHKGQLVQDGPPQDLLKLPDSLYAELLRSEQQQEQTLWNHSVWKKWTFSKGKIQ